jgi:hypothetical protein
VIHDVSESRWHNHHVKRKSDRTGAGGVAIVTTIVNLEMAWIYRAQDQSGTDYGVDAQFEVTDDEGVETGRLIGVQVKSGQSYFREKTAEGFINRPSDRHVRYWAAYGLPVILVLVDPKTRAAYWTYTATVEKTPQGWKLLVPRNQRLGPHAKAELSAIAVGEGTERTRAKTEERERESALEARVEELEAALASYVAALAARMDSPTRDAPPPSLDILALSFFQLIQWAARADFRRDAAPPEHRSAFVLAAERLFFREHIDEHDAAKAVALLLLAQDWGKAGSSFLYAVELTRKMARVDTPSIIDLLADAPLPSDMPRDLRIVQRASQIAARRKHHRAAEELLLELDRLVDEAEAADGLAVVAAAFWEARIMARTNPDRAMRYTVQAAKLRPHAGGVAGSQFPASVDSMWPTLVELLANGIRSDEQLVAWLDLLDAVPAEARSAFLGDEMNVVGLANQFWLEESKGAISDRQWSGVHRVLARLETWSTERQQALLFAAARRGRIVVRGEYEHDLAGAVRMATDVPPFVSADPHATFLLNEIAASQFLYAGEHMESFVAFRDALAVRPSGSSILPNSLLKAAQAAASVSAFENAVAWSREAIDAATADPYRAKTDIVVARAEHALATWYSGDLEGALTIWDDVAEELLAVEDNSDRWRGLVVRFQWADGYLATIYRTGNPPKVDADGRPYGEARPGAFLVDLAEQASTYSDKVRFGVLLGLAAISDKRALDDRTRRWTYAALDLASERVPELRRILALFALPPLIGDRNFRVALDLARTMGKGVEVAGLSPNADTDVLTLSFAMVPAFLAVAAEEGDERSADARTLYSAILQVGGDDPTWRACADVLDAALLSSEDADDRLTRIGAVRGADVSAITESSLPVLCDLAASVVPGLPVNTCLALHMRAALELELRLAIFETMFRRHVVPFFEQFWRGRILADPAAFPDAASLQNRIDAAQRLAGKDRVRAILLAVAEARSGSSS